MQIFFPPRNIWHWLVFALGLGFFLFFQVSLVYEPCQRRTLPVEASDAYQYILKSVALINCPLQNCPALKDLRPQVTPAPKDPQSLVFEKWRRGLRLFPNYFPLYSLGLMTLVKVEGVSCEAALRQLYVLGSFGLTLALSLFLISLVGPLAAGISLAMLSPVMFPLQGIAYVVPSVLSLGMGLLMFAYLAFREGRPGLPFYGMNLIALGLHPMGLIHTSLAVAFGVAYRYPQEKLRSLKGFMPSFILLAIFWGLIHLLPLMKLIPVPAPPGTSYIQGVISNFQYVAFCIKTYHSYGPLGGWFFDYGWPRIFFSGGQAPAWLFGAAQALGAGLMIIGLQLKAGLGRKAVFLAAIFWLAPTLGTLWCIGMMLLILVRGLFDFEPGKGRLHFTALSVLSVGFLVSFFVVRYRVPGSIASRVYVFWALGAIAVFGRGLVQMAAVPGWGQFLPRYLPTSILSRTSSRPLFWRVLLAVFVMVCLLPQVAGAFRYRSYVMDWMINRFDLTMDKTQPHLILQRTSPEDVILYERDDTQIVLPFFLAHGCLARRAVYRPFLPLPPEMKFDPTRVKFLVGLNPFLRLCGIQKDNQDKLDSSARAVKNYLALPPETTLTLQLDSTYQPEAVECLNQPGNLASPSQQLYLTRQTSGKTWSRDLSLPPGAWTVCPLPHLTGGSLSLRNPDKKRTLALAGLRLKPTDNPEWHWPWEKITLITWHQLSPFQHKSFSPAKDISFQGRTYRLTVLQDGGASVVWGLKIIPSIANPK